MVMTRFGTPIWIAARPTPGASYMVSSMSLGERADLVGDRRDGLGDEAELGIGQDEEGS